MEEAGKSELANAVSKDAVDEFDNTGEPVLSGYVTLTNFSASSSTAFLANNGTNIISTLNPGESKTVYVANIGTLVAFSGAAGQPVSGRVCVDADRRVA